MDNVEFLKENCPEGLRGFELLTEGALLVKYHLSKCIKEGNEKLLNEAILWHVKESIGDSYEEGIKEMKKAGKL